MQQLDREETPGGAAALADFVLDAFDAAACELELATGAIRPSPRLNAIYGYPPDHTLTLADCRARHDPAEWAALAAAVREAAAGGGGRFQRELRLALPGGRTRWALARGEVVPDGAARPARVRGVVIDISERKGDETARRESEGRLRLALDAAHMGTFVWYPAVDRADPDERTRALFGLGAGDTLSLATALAGRIHPADGARYAEAVARATDPAGPGWLREDVRVALPGGAERWVAITARTTFAGAAAPANVQMVGMATDITERKRREANLAFLADIGDTLASLSAADAILHAVGAKTGAYLRITTCSFVDVDEARGELTVNDAWNSADVPSLRRTFRTTEYLSEEFGRASRAGETVVVTDTQADPRTAGPAFATLAVRAFVTVPFHRDGTWTHYIAVTDSRPRQWRADELELIEELANRIFPRLERASAEAALRESEERYRSLLDSIGQGFCLFEMLYGPDGEPVDYRFLKVNRTFERHTGLRDPVGRTARELVPGLEPHWFATYGRVAATGEPLRFEQGSEAMGRWFEVEAVRVGAPESRQVALIFTDVSARRQADLDARFLAELGDQIRAGEDAEQLLGAVARLLGRHLRAARCFFAEVDEPGDRWAVRHEHRAPALPSIVGEHRLSAFPPPLLAELRGGRGVSSADTALDERTAPFHEAGYGPLGLRAFATAPLHHNGRWVAGLSAGADSPRTWVDRELALIETVAERTWNAVEKLRLAAGQRASVARLQQLNAASLLLNTAPTRDEVLRLTAEQARALIGAHQAVSSTTADQDWAQTITAVSLSEKYAAWREYDVQPDGSGIYAMVARTRAPIRLTQAELEAHPAWRGFGAEAGRHPPLRGWLAAPLVGREGRTIGLIQLSDKAAGEFTADDEALLVQLAQVAAVALENRQLYAQEQEARAQAKEASRLKDEFLATVSHELRTPLTAFLGYAELLQRRQRDEAYIARTVEKMVQSARAQAELIEDLLDVSRVVSGKLRIEAGPVDLASVVHAALDTVRPTVEAKGLQVHVELDPAAGRVVGDASRLQQVVWNLLSNATKFTPAGGRIEVRLRPSGASAELTVRDTGQGIAPEFLPYVFDRFRQADSSSHRAFGGLGLGLAIVRHLVELHGGTVAATSPGAGQGATFTVRLPLAGAGAQAGGAHAPAQRDDRGQGARPLAGLRVLVLDDQPAILSLIEEILAADGATVRACLAAPEALALVHAWRPDVLVSDIAMPGEDGFWLIEGVRALPPEEGGATPAVALTAYVRMEDRLRVLAAGFDRYVPKPVDAAELRDVVAGLALRGGST